MKRTVQLVRCLRRCWRVLLSPARRHRPGLFRGSTGRIRRRRARSAGHHNQQGDRGRRTVTTGQDGAYSATLLPAGTYEVRATMAGFRTLLRDATVETGSTTTGECASRWDRARRL